MAVTLEKQFDALLKSLSWVKCRLLEEAECRQELGDGRSEDGKGFRCVVDVTRQEFVVEVGVLSEDVGGWAARH